MKNAKAYIFDMDGTLVDNCSYHVIAWREFSRQYGNELTERQILDWMGAKGAYYIAQIMGRELPPDEVAALCAKKEEIYRRLYKPALPEGLREILDDAHARNIPCALATGGPSENVDFILDSLNLRRDFACIIDGTMYTRSKPDPECFLKAADRLGIAPSDCLVFEDAVNGVLAAQAAQMRVIAITFTNPRATLEAANANRVIDSYLELTRLLGTR